MVNSTTIENQELKDERNLLPMCIVMLERITKILLEALRGFRLL